ncbi:hypothetical protein [Pseudoroseicyclus sp. CXY001]|uniref:hypothetical protein n=1 Tax=Pseudoroseicyclus sp. CXY001 TaxID=3242492 RepID=UPI003571749F
MVMSAGRKTGAGGVAEETLAKVVDGVGRGERGAASELFAALVPWLNGLARAMLGEGRPAEQALEAALVAIWAEAPRRAASGIPARPWAALRLHRAAAGQRLGPPMGEPPQLPKPEAYLAANPEARALDPDALIAIRQAWIFGLGYDRLAKLHDLPLAGVRHWMEDNLELMRGEVAGEEPGLEDLSEYRVLAAERALGLLTEEEAEAFAEAESVLPELAEEVAAWELHLALLAEDIPPVPPEPELRARLVARLFGEEAQPLWRRLGIVPAIAGGALAALVLILAVRFGLVTDAELPEATTPVAEEEAAAPAATTGPALDASVAAGRLTAELGPVLAPEGDEELRYWLWLLPAAGPAQPLGAIRPGGEVMLQLPGDLWPEGAELGVSGDPAPEAPILTRVAPVLE